MLDFLLGSCLRARQGRQRKVIKKGMLDKLKGKKSDCDLLFNELMAYHCLLQSPLCLRRHLLLQPEGHTWPRGCSSPCDMSSLRMHTKHENSGPCPDPEE